MTAIALFQKAGGHGKGDAHILKVLGGEHHVYAISLARVTDVQRSNVSMCDRGAVDRSK